MNSINSSECLICCTPCDVFHSVIFSELFSLQSCHIYHQLCSLHPVYLLTCLRLTKTIRKSSKLFLLHKVTTCGFGLEPFIPEGTKNWSWVDANMFLESPANIIQQTWSTCTRLICQLLQFISDQAQFIAHYFWKPYFGMIIENY